MLVNMDQQEDVLTDVVGVRSVVQKPAGETENKAPIPGEDLAEGGALAVSNP